MKFDDGVCQCLVTIMPSNKWCNIVVYRYRPPDTDATSFEAVTQFIIDSLKQHTDDSYRVCLMGDLNFPSINWDLFSVQNGYPVNMNKELLRLLSYLMMNQQVHNPTRGRNILDIFSFYTNDPFLVSNVETSNTQISDHKLVTLSLTSNGTCDSSLPKKIKENLTGFEVINLSKVDFNRISEEIEIVDWKRLRDSCEYEEFPMKFTDTLLSICQKCTC